MDVTVDELIIEEDRPEHIARHSITIDEVFEVIAGDYLILKGRSDKSLLVGKTNKGRLITVVVGPRSGKNRYGLVTARYTKKKEQLLYMENFKGGEKLR
ncbi:hypothetical protein HYT18_00875 [Candidatus Microgenomates bacterium]|nr:hypothetical protein [Candidatus Microgenomates bacterium]